MTGLKDDLQALSSALPRLDEQAAALTSAGRRLETAASGLLDDVQEARAEAVALLARAREALGPLAVHAESDQAGLLASSVAARKPLEDAEPALDALHDGLDAAGDQLRAEAGQLREALAAAATGLDQAGGAADFDVLEAEAHRGVSQLDTAAAMLTSEMSALEAAAARARAACADAMETVLADVRQLSEMTDADIDGILDKLSALGGRRRERVDAALDEARTALHEALAQAQDAAARNVVEPVAAAGLRLHEALEALVAEGRQAVAVTRHGGTALETAVTEAERSHHGMGDVIPTIERILRDLK